MAIKVTPTIATFVLINFVLSIHVAISDDAVPIPADKAQLETWFKDNVKPLADRKGTLDPELEAAEAAPRTIKVRQDGSGEFKTLTEALNSVLPNNKNRVIISLGPGNYTEKILLDREKPFITIIGDPANMPCLINDGTAAKFGTLDSATLIILAKHFMAANVIFVNSAPRPVKEEGGQALALRIGGDGGAFYNCKFIGFQDTLCDDQGRHFFKDCYIEGTVDFIFGNGKTIYINTETHIIPGDQMAMVTAHSRDTETSDTGYSFVHCKVTGEGNYAVLGRAWRPNSRVIFSYSEIGTIIRPEGWSNNLHPEYDKTTFFGEFNNVGPGAKLDARAPCTKKLTEVEVKPFLCLSHIGASQWLLPPPLYV